MKLKGHVYLQLTDLNGNIEYEYSQNNTIGFVPYFNLFNNTFSYIFSNGVATTGNPIISISDTKCELNKFSYNFSGTVSDATFNISGSSIPNEYWPQLTSDTANNRYIIQFKNRFQPGTSTRTINTITLGNNTAGILLTTPCIQSTTQILDIYYSIYIPYDTSKYNDPQFNQQYLNSNVLLGLIFPRSDYNPIYAAGTSTVLNNSFNPGSVAYNIATIWQNGLSINGKAVSSKVALYDSTISTTRTNNITQGTTKFIASLGNNDMVGSIINSLGFVPTSCTLDYTNTSGGISLLTINPITKPTDSPIQSIYLKNPNYPIIYPYLDPSSIGSSTGTIALDGSGWTDADIPLMFKFNIVNSGTGTLASTSYNFQVRPTFGFANNSISSENIKSLYHSVGAVNPTNQISTNMCHWNLPNLPASTFSHTIPARDGKSFVIGDATGISIVNAFTSNFINFDSTTTPAMPTTSVNDYCVGADGKVYVATNDQGLYVISADRTTVTQYAGSSIGTGVTGNVCYSVAVKNNGDVWAAFNGALAKLPNGSSTWTIYNSTTTPSFNYTGISDNNWAHINKIFVNRTNTTDQLLIVRKDVNTCVWWGPTTPTPVVMNNMMAGYSYPAPCLDRAIKHMPNTNSWFFNTNYVQNNNAPNTINICSFGNTGADKSINVASPSLTGSTYGYPFHYICMEPLLYNGNYVMHVFVGSYYNGNANNYNHLYVNVDGTLSHDPYNGSSGGKFMNANNTNCASVFVSPKVLVFQNDTYMKIANMYDVISFTNKEAWDTYGWNSSTNQWEKDYVGNKPMHSDSQVFYKGLKVSFADAPSNSNFNNGEYWFVYVNKGLHKDNSTSATFGMSMNVRDSYMTSELSSYTVPSTGLGSLTNQTLNFYTLNSALAPIYSYKGNAAIGNAAGNYVTLSTACYSEQLFTGDFQINFSATSKSYNSSAWAALGYFDTTLVNPSYGTTGVGYFQFDTSGFYVRENNANKTTPQQFSASDIFSIKRVGNTISYLYNGATIYTSTNTNSNPMRAHVQFISEYSRVFTNMTCSYNETRPVVTIGSQANSTGIFDQNYAMIEAWLTNPSSYQITINGNIANVWTDPTKVPAAGEVLLLQKNGWLVFNPADAGKAITSSVMVLKEM